MAELGALKAATHDQRSSARGNAPDANRDWRKTAYLVQLSRALDEMEEQRLVPEKKVLYQFSARGHDMAQVMLGQRLDRP